MNFESINARLWKILSTRYSQQTEKVMKFDHCDVDGSFLGFVDTYYYLSKIIPKDWIVIDFGCAHAPQGYYFIKHKKYIGVNPQNFPRWTFPNTEHQQLSIKDFIEKFPEILKETKVFAICNYVPSKEVDLVRQNFQHLYCFYPQR